MILVDGLADKDEHEIGLFFCLLVPHVALKILPSSSQSQDIELSSEAISLQEKRIPGTRAR